MCGLESFDCGVFFFFLLDLCGSVETRFEVVFVCFCGVVIRCDFEVFLCWFTGVFIL